MRRCARLVVWILLFLFPAFPSRGGEERAKRRLAITDLAKVDRDFGFQGEYSGSISATDSLRSGDLRRMGLQVVALGDGKFSAVAYAGGLPGGGWYGGEKELLRGEIQGDVLTLESEAYRITIPNRRATVATRAGAVLGQLAMVRRRSVTLGASAPCGAVVLFDGTGTEHFKNGKMTDDDLLQVGTELTEAYRDYRLHVEFRLPYMPYARGQGRANSGVYLQSRYEVQVLDSFGLEGKENECGALYRYRKPDLNMCFPPLTWQTYDIHFQSPRFDPCGNKLCNARLTVYHNGVAVHNHFEVERKTGAGRPEKPELLPIKLQDHGNPVRFRNIWLVDYDAPTVTAPVAQRGRVLPLLGANRRRVFGGRWVRRCW